MTFRNSEVSESYFSPSLKRNWRNAKLLYWMGTRWEVAEGFILIGSLISSKLKNLFQVPFCFTDQVKIHTPKSYVSIFTLHHTAKKRFQHLFPITKPNVDNL